MTLPGTELATYYAQPAVRVAANRRPFLNVGHEPDSSFVLHLDLGTVDMLMATSPETFWQTRHYQGHGAVLVRFGDCDSGRVRTMIEHARGQAAALPAAGSRKR